MKKLVFLFLALATIQVSAQNRTLSKSKTEASSTNSMVENLAANQLTNFTKLLHLNEKQQEQVSVFVIGQLKSEKFQKMITNFSSDKALNEEPLSNQTDHLQSSLLSEESFRKDMSSILDEKQKKIMENAIPK